MLRSYLFAKRKIFNGLYSAALRHENDGELVEAIEGYKDALQEADKSSHNNQLKNRIKAKVKLLHSIIDYHNNLRYKHPAPTI
jgi:hypothetical protein